MRGLRAAIAFLTRLPSGKLDSADFAKAPGWFGAAGLIVGALLALIWMVLTLIWPPVVVAIFVVALGIALTGGLHEDGLADTFDGLGSGRPRERALEIMRDSRIGSFGALALGGAMALRVAPLAEAPALAAVMLVCAHGISRCVMALLLRMGPYVRAQGAGTGMTGPWGTAENLAVCATLANCALIGGIWLGWSALTGFLGAVAGAGLIQFWAIKRLGGVSGDTLGAAQIFAEIGFFLGVLACL